MKPRHPNQKSNCENCGIKDNLDYYEGILEGITLCEDCSTLRVSQISKKNISGVKIKGEGFPPDIAKIYESRRNKIPNVVG